ncbi:uncharacterized protein SETTUDRAFT_168789 [Exserohilum turcica Et28A]|uniref:Uncharacterized protein n=1 Tax=Exserohilum turcicum (strain 28A) TaxID=671987 RepID=R0ITN9_EXST2|nr:uncharacterized protein SETTUDRAFT_168789 [Exserohilum turcica Et28A]EOA88006.1 hypothetical protein SETTUDRAFT_168789 [Exserohilum turcica Et28A]
MKLALLASVLAAAALATSLAKRQATDTGKSDTWQPAASTKATCDTTCGKHISFMRGPQIETVINNACAAMMPPCAYSARQAEPIICTQTIDFKLDGPKNSTQHANVLDHDGNSIIGWDVKFDVTPAAQPKDSPGVFWQVNDCYGYFANLLQKQGPDGCYSAVGSGVGSITVGGDSTLAGTVFKVSIVARTAS